MRSPSTSRVGVPFSARFHSARSGRHPDGTLVGGLRMSTAAFSHKPVMLEEVVEAFASVPAGVVLDATVGGGGHAFALLAAYPRLSLVGLDQDPAAVEAAREVLTPFGARATLVRSRFDRLDAVLRYLGLASLSGALFDLGVSSPQLDVASRGFSYRADAPLDMRMDPDRPISAADLVNESSIQELARLFADNGEARFAGRIARAIAGARPVTTTSGLAEVVRDAIPAPARRTGGHPAKRVFQALRIAVNEELDILPHALDTVLGRLVPGGRAVVLSYHSGEDRIVKERFREAITGGCICLAGLPCVCGAVPSARAVTRKARRPRPVEVEGNPRSESARLRVVEAVKGHVAGGEDR